MADGPAAAAACRVVEEEDGTGVEKQSTHSTRIGTRTCVHTSSTDIGVVMGIGNAVYICLSEYLRTQTD